MKYEETEFEQVANADELFRILAVMSEKDRQRCKCAESDFWNATVRIYENGAKTLSIQTGDYECP